MPRRKDRRTPTTDEGREHLLVSKAMDLAMRQLEDGTASSQVMTHFLKMGSEREKLERARLEQENEVLKGKVEAMASQARVEEMYAAALDAMRSYAGQDRLESEYEDDFYD